MPTEMKMHRHSHSVIKQNRIKHKIKNEKWHYIITKVSTQQEDVTIGNVYLHNAWACDNVA